MKLLKATTITTVYIFWRAAPAIHKAHFLLGAPHKGFWVNFISCKDDDIDEKKAAIYDQESLFFASIGPSGSFIQECDF